MQRRDGMRHLFKEKLLLNMFAHCEKFIIMCYALICIFKLDLET